MAIFHLSAQKPIARSAGRSVTAAAAYRSGTAIFDERTGELHDFTSKRGVLWSKLVVPGGAEIADRAAFWNGIEAHHRRGDAVLAREVIVALPAELDAMQRQVLAETFCHEIARRYGVAVDLALHAPDRRGNGLNWHAHLLQAACHVDESGRLGKKVLELDPIHCSRNKLQDAVAWMRPRWADLVNQALHTAGCESRVDHRSHKDLGIDQEPMEHEGFGVGRKLRKARNAERHHRNAELRSIDEDIERALRERAKAAASDKIAEIDNRRVLRLQLAEVEKELMGARGAMVAATAASARALPAQLIQEARAGLPKLLKAAQSAKQALDSLEQQLLFAGAFRWLRRRKLSKRLTAAQDLALRLSTDAAVARADAQALSLEDVRKQQLCARSRTDELLLKRDQILAELEPGEQAVLMPSALAQGGKHVGPRNPR